MGVQLTALRECTRDTEWKLLKLTIVDFASQIEVQFAAERTAAHAARIQAPLRFHGDEPELTEALHGIPASKIQLEFQCHTILVYSRLLLSVYGIPDTCMLAVAFNVGLVVCIHMFCTRQLSA